MGDRALVLFRNEQEVSPTVYLHWAGSEVPEMLDILKEHMTGRYDDVAYACARFIGICHVNNYGNTGLGVWNTDELYQDAVFKNDAVALEGMSHGDAGVVVVDVRDFSWRAYGGYLAEQEQEAA